MTLPKPEKPVFEFICPRCGFDKTRLGRGLTVREAHEGHCGLCHEEGEEVAFNVWIEGEKLWQTRCLFGQATPRISNAKTVFGKERERPHENNKKSKKLLAEYGRVISHTGYHVTIRDKENSVLCDWFPNAGKWRIGYTDRIGNFDDLVADLSNLKNGIHFEDTSEVPF